MSGTFNELIVFPWSPNFDSGLVKIDEQHKQLVNIINELAIFTAKEAHEDDILRIFEDLVDYTGYHFKYEESVWDKYLAADPDYIEHQKSHGSFLKKVLELKQEVTSEPTRKVIEDVLQFLISWLLYHILDTDKQLALIVQALDDGIALAEAKQQAHEEVTNRKVLTNTIIDMYNMLTIRSLHLLSDHEQIKKLNERLSQSEEREKRFTDSLIDSIPGLLFILDNDHRLLRWNDGFHKLLGYSDNELKQKEFFSFFSEKTKSIAEGEMEVIHQFGSTQFEAEILRKDGSLSHHLLTCHYNHGRDTTYYTGVGVDLTIQKQVEQEFTLNQELFEEAESIANLGHWSLDHATGALSWSDQIFKIFNLDPRSFSPSYENFLATIHPEDRKLVERTFSKSVEAREPYQVTHRLLMESGEIKYVREKGKTSYSEEGSPLLSIGNVQDITKEVIAENKLLDQEEALRGTLMSTVQAISRSLEARDPYTAGHQQRVAAVCVKIAEKLELDNFRIEGIRLGASIHDLGKISIPAEFLAKPTKLTEAEFKIIQTHSSAGYEIIKDIEFPWPIKEIVEQHHERLDGSGYPNGLKGDEIIFESRIVAVADVFEAMSTDRPYRPAPGIERALEEIKKNRGTSFDPRVVDALVELVEVEKVVFFD